VSKIIRIGRDTSKSVQLHGVDAAEKPVLREKLRRSQVLEFFSKLEPTKIGLEACGASHYSTAPPSSDRNRRNKLFCFCVIGEAPQWLI